MSALRDAVSVALQQSSSRRSKVKVAAAGKSSSSVKAATDFASPAPGDHHSAAGITGIYGFGNSGPAYSIAGKLSSSGNGISSVSLKEAAAKLAAADGHAAVLAAAAALDRAAGVPGVGSYNVERQFPHPEGKMLHKPKPILKKQQLQQLGQASCGSSAAAKIVAGATGSNSSAGATLQSSSRQLSSIRRVSWAE
jgi:hypothetical protein